MNTLKKLILSVISLFLVSISLNSSIFAQRPADKFERRVFHSNNDSIQYRLFIPEMEDSSMDLFPLIMTLHGSGQIGNDNNKHIVEGRIAETWAENMAQIENPTFVFSPQIPNQSQSLELYINNYWAPTISLILDSLIQEFPIDTTRLYITGLSLGGMITWGFIYWSEMERFAAAIPMSGGRPPINSEPIITDIPIWGFCGVSDVGTIDEMRNVISSIEGAGHLFEKIYSTYGNIGFTIDEIAFLNSLNKRHIYTEFTDGAHEIWDKTYDDPVLHYWLFSQVKAETTPIEEKGEWIVYNNSNSELPSNSINCLVIDEDNTKWIGTDNGLAKFDGNTWEIFDTLNSNIPSNYISCIAIDQFNNKWIGTFGKLAKFDGSKWEVYDTTNSEIPSIDYFGEIAIDHDDNKWLADVRAKDFSKLGLVKYDNNSWTVYDTVNSGLPTNNVFCVEVDEDNNKWIGTAVYLWGPSAGKGLVKFDDTTWTKYNEVNSELPNNSIADLAFDSENNLWLLTQDGLTKFDGINWNTHERLVDNCGDVYCLVIDSHNKKWIGLNGVTNGYATNGCGVSIFHNDEWEKIHATDSGLPSNSVKCIKVDKFGNKWIGTKRQIDGEFSKESNGGLAVFNEEGIITKFDNTLIDNTVINNFLLSQNYPNPFNPRTIIQYSISKQSNVTLKLFDVLGSEVTTLVNKEQSVGNYELEFDGKDLTSGIYFYRLQANDFVETKKMILLK